MLLVAVLGPGYNRLDTPVTVTFFVAPVLSFTLPSVVDEVVDASLLLERPLSRLATVDATREEVLPLDAVLLTRDDCRELEVVVDVVAVVLLVALVVLLAGKLDALRVLALARADGLLGTAGPTVVPAVPLVDGEVFVVLGPGYSLLETPVTLLAVLVALDFFVTPLTLAAVDAPVAGAVIARFESKLLLVVPFTLLVAVVPLTRLILPFTLPVVPFTLLARVEVVPVVLALEAVDATAEVDATDRVSRERGALGLAAGVLPAVVEVEEVAVFLVEDVTNGFRLAGVRELTLLITAGAEAMPTAPATAVATGKMDDFFSSVSRGVEDT